MLVPMMLVSMMLVLVGMRLRVQLLFPPSSPRPPGPPRWCCLGRCGPGRCTTQVRPLLVFAACMADVLVWFCPQAILLVCADRQSDVCHRDVLSLLGCPALCCVPAVPCCAVLGQWLQICCCCGNAMHAEFVSAMADLAKHWGWTGSAVPADSPYVVRQSKNNRWVGCTVPQC